MGKHLDKREKDSERRVRTLPVLLGDGGGRLVMGLLVILFYLSISALAGLGLLPWGTLLVWATLPRAIRVLGTLRRPMPAGPKEAFDMARKQIPKDLREQFDPHQEGANSFPLWPLWFVVWGVWWVRHAGLAFVVGLVLGFFEGPWIQALCDWLGCAPAG